MGVVPLFALALCVTGAAGAPRGPVRVPTVEIAPGVMFPTVQLGGCTTSPGAGVAAWLATQPPPAVAAIDTAFGYHDQPAIAAALALARRPRASVWLTSKIPGGLAKTSPCTAADPEAAALACVREDLRQLNVSFVDLMLLHEPCDMTGAPDPRDALIWKGLRAAVAKGYARAIGVDRMLPAQVEACCLAGPDVHKPAVLMARMSVAAHDEPTIRFCKARGITYNAFGVMSGCGFTAPLVTRLAKKYAVSAAAVCGAWTLQRGCTMAVSTGCDDAKVPTYTAEDLDVFGFRMTAAELAQISALGNSSSHPPRS